MDSLISIEELDALAGKPDIRVVDLRWSLEDEDRGLRDYQESHIPGATYLHWLRDLSDPSDPVEGQVATPEQFSAAMSNAGIANTTLVVAYDDGEILMAPRLLWMLRYYGHDRVQILDGGWHRWVASGRAVESGQQAYPRTEFHAVPHPGLRRTKEEVQQLLGSTTQILDCRMDQTWNESGEHIPGARRFPAPSLLDEAGTYIGLDEIRARASSLGLDTGQDIVLYCGGGVSASAAFMALRGAGYTKLSVYDGSWSEWGSDPEMPKVQHGT